MHVASDAAETDALRVALDELAPDGVGVGVRRISSADVASLLPAERDGTDAMADVRLAEFATGRVLLRRLLGTSEPIVRSPDRAPSLPPGTKASLAHDRRHAIAAVSHDPEVVALGIDLERIGEREVTAEMAAMIVRADDVTPDALCAFVMKEATYKAWSRLGGAMLEHHDVRVEARGTRFSAHVVAHPSPGVPTSFDGAIRRTAKEWVALVVVRRRPFA